MAVPWSAEGVATGDVTVLGVVAAGAVGAPEPFVAGAGAARAASGGPALGGAAGGASELVALASVVVFAGSTGRAARVLWLVLVVLAAVFFVIVVLLCAQALAPLRVDDFAPNARNPVLFSCF